MALTAKQAAHKKLLEYLGDPDNDFVSRGKLSTEVLGYKNTNTLNTMFTALELQEIEAEAFEIRLQRSARQRGNIYNMLYNKAIKDGSVTAAQEWLNRVEGKAVDRMALKAEIASDTEHEVSLDDKALDAAILALEHKLSRDKEDKE